MIAGSPVCKRNLKETVAGHHRKMPTTFLANEVIGYKFQSTKDQQSSAERQ